MNREQVLGKIEQMMFEALQKAHQLWLDNCGGEVDSQWTTPPPQTLVKLYKDTHAAVMSSIKQKIDSSEYYENLTDEEVLAGLEVARESIMRKISKVAVAQSLTAELPDSSLSNPLGNPLGNLPGKKKVFS